MQCAYLWMGAVCRLAEPIGEGLEVCRGLLFLFLFYDHARCEPGRIVMFWGGWRMGGGHLELFSLTEHAVIGALISPNAACHASPASDSSHLNIWAIERGKKEYIFQARPGKLQ
ncbi:hypothetical protein V8E51_007138 [Hyaloscypha variabilis]